MDEHPTFTNKDEEIVYWKHKAESYLIERNNAQQELDDYSEESKQLEKELETSLAHSEKRNKELELKNNRANQEIESLRKKLEQHANDIAKLQAENQSLVTEKTQLTRYIRELEQKNDDLERAERAVAETVAEVEASLNLAIEKNAILESEVDEKETLKVKLQRLVDETRDLKQELMVKERAPDNERIINGHIDTNRLKVEMETQTSSSPLKREFSYDINEIRQPSRAMALTLVNEILKKIGKLESKIAAHRANERNLQIDSNRVQRRLTRGTSSPSTKISSVGN